MTHSKTLGGAQVVANDAAFLKFDLGSKDPLIGGTRPIGGVNVDQRIKGVNYPNVQSAIDDLYSIATVRVGDILVTTNATPPQATGQVETLTFSGTATWTGNTEITKTIIHVYGVPIILDVNATAAQTAAKVNETFTDLMNRNILFKRVALKGAQKTQVEVEMIDAVTHTPFNRTENGITITGNIDSPASSGYGTWSRMGTESKFGETLYYFKRIA